MEPSGSTWISDNFKDTSCRYVDVRYISKLFLGCSNQVLKIFPFCNVASGKLDTLSLLDESLGVIRKLEVTDEDLGTLGNRGFAECKADAWQKENRGQ